MVSLSLSRQLAPHHPQWSYPLRRFADQERGPFRVASGAQKPALKIATAEMPPAGQKSKLPAHPEVTASSAGSSGPRCRSRNRSASTMGNDKPCWPGQRIFTEPGYCRIVQLLLAIQFAGFAAWQVEALKPLLRANTQCSWHNVVSENRWWAAITAHVCHRTPEHFCTNLIWLAVPSFLLQASLPWWHFASLCGAAAVAGSFGDIVGIFWTYAPEEPLRLGLWPWTPPRFRDLAPALRCPDSHDLDRQMVGQPGRPIRCICDECGRGICQPEETYRCSVCDYDLCLECAGKGEAEAISRVRLFRNAFDEFCFLREVELSLGVDSMLSDAPFVTHPEALQPESRLHLADANRLVLPYLEWSRQAVRGSMGSSAIVQALMASCTCWLLHLARRGFRDPVLFIIPMAAGAQVLVDIWEALRFWVFRQTNRSNAQKVDPVGTGQTPEEAFFGHLAGTMIGLLAYLVCFRRLFLTQPLRWPLAHMTPLTSQKPATRMRP